MESCETIWEASPYSVAFKVHSMVLKVESSGMYATHGSPMDGLLDFHMQYLLKQSSYFCRVM